MSVADHDHKTLVNLTVWRSKLLIALIAVCALFMSDFIFQTRSEAQSPVIASRANPSRVIGTITVQTPTSAGAASQVIELPDIPVTLTNARTKAVVTSGITTLNGGFDLRAPRQGSYQVCATVSGTVTCSKILIVNGRDISARIIAAGFKAPLLFGRVLTGDLRPCWVNDSFFKLDVSTRVTATNLSDNKVSASVRANVQGEYALFGLATGRYRVAAQCEKAQATSVVALGGGSARQNLNFANRAPRLVAIDAKSTAGTSVLRAAPGDKVKMETLARDPDKDNVEFMWRTTQTGGDLDGTTTATQSWALPKRAGLQSIYVMARDGKGGYAYRRFDVRSGGERMGFSGRVIDEVTQRPVGDAEVTLAGQSVRTNAQGWFSLAAKPMAGEQRYVVNIKHVRYALMSRIYDREQSGTTYELIRAQVGRTPADGRLDFVDTGSSGPCGTAPEQRAATLRQLAMRRFSTVDGGFGEDPEAKAKAARFKALVDARDAKVAKGCRARGVQIRIPASGLVDAQGRKASGMITSSLATLDPTRRALPGDYRAQTRGGEETQLLSFGAVYAEFRGAGGEMLNLAPGQEAELRIPVPDVQAEAAPPSIALWSYDEKQGRWVEEGEAALVNTPEGRFYVGKTKHFSTINMDIAKTDGTCARLHVAPGSFTGWSNLRLRAFVSYGGTTSATKETPMDGSDYHAIFRIPFGPATAPNTLRLEVRGTFDPAGPLPPAESVLLNDIVSIDAIPPNAPPIADSTALSYPYPYDECGTPIELALPAGVVPDYGVDATGRPYFLSGPFGSFNAPVGFDPNTYYNAIDPGMARTTLGDWWVLNGFGADGLGAGNPSFTRASYLNHKDLGFGRDMHCAKNNNGAGPNLACYVTNYGLPDNNPDNATAARDQDPAKQGATVTMEFDAAAPAGQGVQFYVYGGGVATSGRIGFADLDGFGPKAVPQLCTICHGGNYDAGLLKVDSAQFREFDLPSFKYADGASWDYGQPVSGTTPSASDFGNFAALNEMVHDIAPTSKIGLLITAWYTGGFGGNPLPDLPAAPAGWNASLADTNAYLGSYAQACRTCHLARDVDFTATTVAGVPDFFFSNTYYVCGIGRQMPNAVVTYKNFWANTLLVNNYEGVIGIGANTCRND